jgi:phosphoenolpyruvate phosphomutase
MKKVYVSMIADLLHAGHINILEEAAKHGEVTVGLLTSTAINELNDTAYLKYQQRLDVIKNLTMVANVIPQEDASYKTNITKIKPDYVVHGDDWKDGKQSKYRKEVIELLSEWDGELIEVAYREVFKTAIELNQFHTVDMACDRAPYIDQAQSIN